MCLSVLVCKMGMRAQLHWASEDMRVNASVPITEEVQLMLDGVSYNISLSPLNYALR